MKTINVPNKQQVDEKAGAIFNALENQLGMVPNLYATIGYSSDVLEAYLNYDAAVDAASFSKREGEAIKLAVSEVNNCQYCKAAHTVLAQMNGFTEDETIDIRVGKHHDLRLNVLVTTAQELAAKRGAISEEGKQKFFAQGFDEKAYIDLIAMVHSISFTNFVHNATQVPVDFPQAPALLKQSV